MEEITIDMARSMNTIDRCCFSNASDISFSCSKISIRSIVQEIRIKHRWDAIDKDYEAIEIVIKNKKSYTPIVLPNGDTVKQLLARSRYILFKKENK